MQGADHVAAAHIGGARRNTSEDIVDFAVDFVVTDCFVTDFVAADFVAADFVEKKELIVVAIGPRLVHFDFVVAD